MTKKKSHLLLQRVYNLVNMPVFVAKTRLVSLKKSRKMKHYNYRYVQEYQFSSADNSPLIQLQRNPFKNKQKSFKSTIYFSISLVSKCFGVDYKGEEIRRMYPVENIKGGEIKRMYPIESVVAISTELAADSCEESEVDVDERAEKFIQRFYEEMRMQRQESLMQNFNAVIDD